MARNLIGTEIILEISLADSALGYAISNDACDATWLIGSYVNIKGDKFHYVHAPNVVNIREKVC